jgi:hypothetical protein
MAGLRHVGFLVSISILMALVVTGCAVAVERGTSNEFGPRQCADQTRGHIADWNLASDWLMENYVDQTVSTDTFLLGADLMEAKLDLVLAEMSELSLDCGVSLPIDDVINLYEDEINAYILLIDAVMYGTIAD